MIDDFLMVMMIISTQYCMDNHHSLTTSNFSYQYLIAEGVLAATACMLTDSTGHFTCPATER